MRINEVADGRLVESVDDDDESWGLYEGDFLNPLGTEHRRYQVVYVRLPTMDVDGTEQELLHAHVTDLGLSALQPYPPLRIFSVGTDKVGEVRQYAAEMRADHAPELPDVDPKKWSQDTADDLERKRKAYLRQTQFGAGQVASVEQRSF